MYDAQAIAAAEAVLNLLSPGVDEAKVVSDPRLRRTLDPLRRLPPLRVRCRRVHRRATICWVAVHPNEALAIHAGSRVVASQSRGAGGFYDLVYSPRHPAVGTASWIRDAEQHGGYVTLAANPAVGSGWPLRYTFHCFVCQDDHPLTNSKMLRLIATEIIAGSREIRLLEP